MVKRMLLIIFLICVADIRLFAEAGEPNAIDVLERYTQSLLWESSVSMEVEVKTELIDPIEGENEDPAGSIAEYIFAYRRDGSRYEWVGNLTFSKAGTNVVAYKGRFQLVFDNSQYIRIEQNEQPDTFLTVFASMRNIEDKRKFASDSIEYGGPLEGHLNGNRKSIAELLRDAGNLHLRDEKETIDGTSCYVLEGTTDSGRVTAWIAPEKGYNALKWTMQKSPNDLFYNRKFSEEWPEIVEWTGTLDSVKVKQIGRFFIPVEGHYIHNIRFKNGDVGTLYYQYRRSELVLCPDFEALSAFKINLPNGTDVSVEESPNVRYIWQNGKIAPDVDAPTFEEIDKMVQELKDEKK